MARPKPPIQRSGTTFSINLAEEELELVRRLMGELRALLTKSAPDDERLRRLFPAAYHTASDREFEDEYQRLMREELVASRLMGLDTVESFLAEGASRKKLAESQMLAFLQALNGVRLVLGTILDIGEDDDPDEVDDDDPLVGEHHLYNYLSWLLDWSVRALQGSALR